MKKTMHISIIIKLLKAKDKKKNLETKENNTLTVYRRLII